MSKNSPISVTTADDIPDGPLSQVTLPDDYNYIAVFLTLACNLNCQFCLTRFGLNGKPPRPLVPMSGEKWIKGINRLQLPQDLPVTLQGGEPSVHPDFLDIISGLKPDLAIDILTNLQFDIYEFMERIPPERLRRPSPYASIRVSYHPDHMDEGKLAKKVQTLLNHGYDIGVWGIDHPAYKTRNTKMQKLCQESGIDFRLKEFLGYVDGVLMGSYRYSQAVGTPNKGRRTMCRTTELLLSPNGTIHNCHSHLFHQQDPVANILDPGLIIDGSHRPCTDYGQCHPCDIKVKTNRFQQNGHTSVEILFPCEEDSPAEPLK